MLAGCDVEREGSVRGNVMLHILDGLLHVTVVTAHVIAHADVGLGPRRAPLTHDPCYTPHGGSGSQSWRNQGGGATDDDSDEHR